MLKRYVYRFKEQELGQLLAETGIPLEVLNREGQELEVAAYKPLEGYEPLRVEEVKEGWEDWRGQFGPVEVESFVILPPWKEAIYINPARAFGTGLHATTQLCLKMLSEYVSEGDRVLDVGTGSGILAIASKKLGAGEVVAIDVSEEAVQECIQNAKRNGVELECMRATAADISSKFDVVVANLEIDIFRKELRHITPLFDRWAIFSGIYGKRELEEFLGMLREAALKEVKILELEDWFGVAASR